MILTTAQRGTHILKVNILDVLLTVKPIIITHDFTLDEDNNVVEMHPNIHKCMY